MSFYYDVIGTCWFAFVAVWVIAAAFFGGARVFLGGGGLRASGRRYDSRRDRALRVALVLIVIVVFNVRGPMAIPASPTTAGALAAAGDLLCVIGLLFAVWARVTLGRHWGMPMTVREEPQLVTSGPYQYVRHPIYSGLSAMLIGTALVFPAATLPAAAAIAYWCFSAVREERDMEARFPDAYPEYRKRTRMLVPFVI